MAESNPPDFGTTRPKPVGEDVHLERPLPGNEVGQVSARTQP